MTNLIVLLVILHLKWSEAIRCFECTDIAQPHICTKVAFCSSDEYCFIDMIVSSSGYIVFNSGCRLKMYCSPKAGALIGKRSNNIPACTSCCMGDYCNDEGCGTTAIPREQRGPYCYNCNTMIDPKACTKVRTCSIREKCILYTPPEYRGLPETIYRSQCENTAACDVLAIITSNNNCTPSCCNTDFCNTKCGSHDRAVRSLSQPVPTSTTITFQCNVHDGYIHLKGENTQLCVKIVTSHSNWDDAQSYCKHSGGDLVVLDTTAKATLMRNKLNHDSQYRHQSCYWIGAKDFNRKNQYSWVNGHPVMHGDWYRGQPNHYDGGHDQDCVCMYNSGAHFHWHDIYCAKSFAYICERK